MKLTKYIRDAFVRAAMNDVPVVDYYAQAQTIAQADALEQMPDKIKAIHADPAVQGYLNKHIVRLTSNWGWGSNQAAVYAMSDFKLSPAAIKKIEALVAAKAAQDASRDNLQTKLRGAAYAVTTRKALVNMLPEFENYLPADEAAACKTLPAVANLFSDFVKAGWPKNVKRPAKKGAGAA